jgi:hypothetical protein
MPNHQVNMLISVVIRWEVHETLVVRFTVLPLIPPRGECLTTRITYSSLQKQGVCGLDLLGLMWLKLPSHVLMVQLPHTHGPVAARSQGSRNGPCEWIKGDAVASRSMRRGPPAGHQAGSIGHARGVCHCRVLEHDALGGERVQVWRLHGGVAAETQVIGTELIGNDEQHVGPAVGGCAPLPRHAGLLMRDNTSVRCRANSGNERVVIWSRGAGRSTSTTLRTRAGFEPRTTTRSAR